MKKIFFLVLSIILLIDFIQTQEDEESCEAKHKKPVPGDCSSFYKCLNGRLVIYICPTNYAFDAKRKVCVSWRRASCDYPLLRKIENCDQSKSGKRYRGSCNRFTLCVNNEMTIYRCGNNMNYDENSGKCVNESLPGCPL